VREGGVRKGGREVEESERGRCEEGREGGGSGFIIFPLYLPSPSCPPFPSSFSASSFQHLHNIPIAPSTQLRPCLKNVQLVLFYE
jgi:hypothetical protein